MKMIVSILGCGWLGTSLGKHLIEQNYQVNGSSRSPIQLDILSKLGINPFQIDLENKPSKQSLDSFVQCNALIVCIPPTGMDNYSELFIPIVDSLKKEAKTPKIIFISSTSVYSDYGIYSDQSKEYSSKIRSQEILKTEDLFLDSFTDSIILRLAGLAGPKRNPGKFLSGRVNVANPNGPVNFVHQADCIAIITLLLSSQNAKGIYNVCSPEHPTRKEFYCKHAKQLNLEIPQFSMSEREKSKVIEANRLLKELNYRFIFPNPMNYSF